jgi:hypothetical protein
LSVVGGGLLVLREIDWRLEAASLSLIVSLIERA